MMNITYKCTCMPHEAIIEVPSRPPGSDLMLWMNVVQATIGMDHIARSPKCQRDTIEYAKIPMDDGAEGLGEKPRLSS